MTTGVYQLRYAVRYLGKNRGLTLSAILILALGIGAATTIFSVVNTVLLQPLGYRQPERLVLVRERLRTVTPELLPVPAPDVAEFQSATDVFEGASGWVSEQRDLSSESGQPVRAPVSRVTADLFQLLRARPALGRTFTPNEDRQRQPLAVLSDTLWRTRYASDPDILGRKILLDRIPHTIIGVMPPTFVFPPQGAPWGLPAEIWVPMAFSPEELAAIGDNFNYNVIARLGSGISLERANSTLQAVARRIHERFPPGVRDTLPLEAVAVRLTDQIVGNVRTLVWMLAAAVTLLLLIACANVASLLMSRAAAREREFAIRSAVGASRLRLVCEWLTESLLLSLAGGGLGVMFAWYGTDLLARLTTFDIPRLSDVRLDGTVLGVSFGLAVLTGLLFGTVPAFFAGRTDLTQALKAGGRSSASRDRRRLGSALVIGEIALALMLLVGAGLLFRSFLQLRATDPGFRAENVLTLSLSLPETAYKSAQIAAFTPQLDQRLRGIPGVLAVACANDLPMQGENWYRLFTLEDETALQGKRPPTAFTVVRGDYFQSLGIALRRGRVFTDSDRNARNVIVSEGTARQLWPDQDPIEKRMRWGSPGEETPWTTVIGVVADVKEGPLERPSSLHTYALAGSSLDQGPLWFSNQHWIIRSAQPPETVAASVRAAVASLDPQLPIAKLKTMENAVDGSLSPRRIQTWVLGLFACAALMLAAVGIYGLIAYSVTQRTPEIGIRMALGAGRIEILRLVLGQALVLTIVGIVAGAGLSFALTRYIATLLFGVKPTDAATFGAVAGLLITVTVVASLIPARKAVRIDPMIALRRE